MSQAGFRLDIQGLRGVSVLLVVLFHAGLGLSGGFIGVDVFFAISGFVIMRVLLGEIQRNGNISIKHFYARRVRRLLPALALLLTVVGLFCVLLLSPAFPQPQALQTALAAGLSAANLFLWRYGGGYFTPVDEQNPFVHTWSLGVEEQFYLFLPLVVFLSWRYGERWFKRPRASLVTVVGATAALSVVLSIVWTYEIGPLSDHLPRASRFAFYGPVARMWEFAAGVLVAVWSRVIDKPLVATLAGVSGLALILVAAIAFEPTTPFPGVAAALPTVGACLIFVAGSGPVTRLLAHPVLVWFGDRSYSWYLWHWPFIVLAPIAFPDVKFVVPVAAALSILPSMASFRYVELRYRMRKGGPVFSAPKLAAVSVCIPLVVLGGSLYGANRGWGLERHPELLEATISQRQHCFEAATPVEQCTFGRADSDSTLMLVGDSHADTLSEAVVPAATEKGYRLVSRTFLSCPFITEAPNFDPDCVARQADTLQVIREIRPDILVIANRSPIAIATIQGTEGGLEEHEIPSREGLSAWQRVVEKTFRDVKPYVKHVLMVSVVPYFRVDDFDRALPTLLWPKGKMPRERIETIQASRGLILAAEARAANAVPGLVTLFDPRPYLCDATYCHIRDQTGMFLYRDNNHLTARTARTLSGPLGAALCQLSEHTPAAHAEGCVVTGTPSKT